MNDDRDLSPVVRTWLREVPDLADRAWTLASVRARVHDTPQGRRRPAAWRPRSMFSATRLIAAVAIITLGTGTLFLAASTIPSPAPAASPSPAPTLSLVTEEVEPGVVRVIGDGVHVLGQPSDRYYMQTVGPDGSVWVWSSEDLYQIGDITSGSTVGAAAREAALPFDSRLRQLEVSPDGTLWATDVEQPNDLDGRLLRFDGSNWREMPTGLGGVQSIDIGPDGSVWSTLREDLSPDQSSPYDLIARLSGEIWTDLPFREEVTAELAAYHRFDLGSMQTTTDGAAWTTWRAITTDDFIRSGLLGFDGQAWRVVDPAGRGSYHMVDHLDIGSDDTLWVYLETLTDPSDQGENVQPGYDERTDQHLARLVGDEWTVYSAADGVPYIHDPELPSGGLKVGPDGTVWITAYILGSEYEPGQCDGLRSFDGSVWIRYLEGRCLMDLDIAPDGIVWVVEGELDYPAYHPRDIYRIDPRVRRTGS